MWPNSLVPTVLNMSLTASIVIIFVLLARLLLRRAPKIFSYALWAVVLLRLLCPLSLTSKFSLLSIIDAPVTAAGSPEYVSSDIFSADSANGGEGIVGVQPDAVGQAAPNSTKVPLYLTSIVWFGGIVALLTYSAAQFFKLRRRLIGAVPLRDNIYLADYLCSPFVMGLFRPKIYLPSSLSAGEQGFIIRHEQHHIRRGDHVVKILAFAALCIHWFNPLVWLAFVLSGRDMEMSCDEAVLKGMDGDIRADYSSSLLRLSTGRKIIVGTPLAFGEGDTKGRIKNVMNYKKPALWVIIAAIIILALVSVLLLTNPASEPNILDREGVGPYELTDGESDLLRYFSMQGSSQILSFNAPEQAITLDVNVYCMGSNAWEKIGGGGISIGEDREPVDRLNGTFTMQLKDNYSLDFNISSAGQIHFATDEILLDSEITSSTKAFLTEFQQIELNEEIPVAIMVYDSGTSMRSYRPGDYFEPGKLEGMDLVQVVTLTFTDSLLG